MKSSADAKRQSIFQKLLTGYIGITLLVVMLTALVSFFLVRQYTINSNRDDLQSKAEAVADMLGLPGGMTRWLTNARWTELQTVADAQLTFINPDGTLNQLPPKSWPSEEGDWPNIEKLDLTDTLDEELIQSLLGGQIITDVRKLDFMEYEVVFAGAPVIDSNNKPLGAVLMYRPLRQVSASTQQIVLMMVLSGIVALLVAMVLAYFMGRRISKPLVMMNQTAKHIADGHYGELVTVQDSDEVGELGQTLNHLSSRLSVVIQNLSEEKSKLEQVLLSIGEGIIAIDRTGQIVHQNPAATELMSAMDDGVSDQRMLLTRMMQRSMDERVRAQQGFTDRMNRTIEAISSPVRGEDGAVLGSVCLIRDISEAQRLEQMRRDYIANISHELRTPLTGIRGMVEPLLDGILESDQEKDDCYRVIYQETLRLERLIGEMLDLSRLQDGRIQMELEPMEIKPLFQAAARRLSEKAAEGGVALLVDAPDALRVMGNEARIIQALIILMDNAISFTKPGGSVTLSARDQGGMAQLRCTDTGAGINPEDLPYIWERFYKADKSRMHTRGVGLGLSICKLVVELMGGTISVETELGVGSSFIFALRKPES